MAPIQLSPNLIKLKGIFVLDEDYNKGGKDLLFSNADFLNALRTKHLIEYEEWSDAATMSYYVDVFRYQNNRLADISGYLHNIYPFERISQITRSGLDEMGAVQHLAIYDKVLELAHGLGADKFQQWLDYEHDDEAFEDAIAELGSQLDALEKDKPLLDISSSWLVDHPDLHVINAAQWDAKLQEFSALVPDMDWRIEKKLENEDRSMKISRALCKIAEVDFKNVTSYVDVIFDGEECLGKNIVTEQGDYLYFENKNINKAYLRKHGSDAVICQIETGDNFK